MKNRFEIVIGVEDNETGGMSYQQLTRTQAKIIAMALNMKFEYDPEDDDVYIYEDCYEDEELADYQKENHLLIGCIRSEEIISNEEYRFKLNAKIEERRYDNYYEVDKNGNKYYHSSLESYREELDKITDAIDKMP